MQEQLEKLIIEETALAEMLLRTLEEENRWLPQSEPGCSSPFLDRRAELLDSLMRLGQERVALMSASTLNAHINGAMAKLANLILRIQDLNRRNQHMVLLHLNGLEKALKYKKADETLAQATYGPSSQRLGRQLGVG